MSRARLRLLFTCVLVSAVLAASVTGVGAPAANAKRPNKHETSAPLPGCATPDAPGGEWRTYGHDLANTRNQSAEDVIGRANVASLEQAWAFSTATLGDTTGDFTGTPIVADGCVYAGTNGGWVVALNADTGVPAWTTRLPQGSVNASVAVADRKVIVAASRAGSSTPLNCLNPACAPTECANGCIPPTVAALSQATGEILWSTAIDDQQGSDLYSTPVVHDGMALVGVSGGNAEFSDEQVREAFQGNLVVLDVATGAVLAKVWAIHPPHQPDDAYAGASIWSTPAVDTATGYAYVGTGNPFNPEAEHEHANAILKIDLDRSRPTFGQVVDSFKGTVDEYYSALSALPCGNVPGNQFPFYPQGVGACGDIDLDFGAAPNLFTLPDGRKVVGEGQKSGIYHLADAGTMDRVWGAAVGPPSEWGGVVGSTAYDGTNVIGPVTVPGYLWAVDGATGTNRWFGPIFDGMHWGNPVTVANGVVYTLALYGELNTYDAKTGWPIWSYPLWSTAETRADPAVASWGGVAVARHTVYVNTGTQMADHGLVVALRPAG
jgi:polyvinyl alcohol dehydrogenase (cytochrome)